MTDEAADVGIAAGPPEVPMQIKITVKLGCGHELIYWDKIEEKYPFWCAECQETIKDNSYPWSLTTAMVRPPF